MPRAKTSGAILEGRTCRRWSALAPVRVMQPSMTHRRFMASVGLGDAAPGGKVPDERRRVPVGAEEVRLKRKDHLGAVEAEPRQHEPRRRGRARQGSPAATPPVPRRHGARSAGLSCRSSISALRVGETTASVSSRTGCPGIPRFLERLRDFLFGLLPGRGTPPRPRARAGGRDRRAPGDPPWPGDSSCRARSGAPHSPPREWACPSRVFTRTPWVTSPS